MNLYFFKITYLKKFFLHRPEIYGVSQIRLYYPTYVYLGADYVLFKYFTISNNIRDNDLKKSKIVKRPPYQACSNLQKYLLDLQIFLFNKDLIANCLICTLKYIILNRFTI